jgi:hypothetical protein
MKNNFFKFLGEKIYLIPISGSYVYHFLYWSYVGFLYFINKFTMFEYLLTHIYTHNHS